MSDTPPLVSLTQKAADYALKILEKEGIKTPPGGIRFRVKAGGCHGLEYIYELEHAEARQDIIILSRGVRILIDPKSMAILKGTTIDHSDNLLEKPFIFNNPSTRSSCGCGQSFEA